MIVQYFQFLPLFKSHILLYKAFIILILLLIYSTAIILTTMAFRIKYRKVKIFWPIDFLKLSLPIISYFFFGQIFLVLTSIFYCREEELYESPYLHCLEGLWIYSLKPAAVLGMFLQIIIGFITNSLYYTQFFEKDRFDLLKKIDTFPDVIFMFIKIAIIILFISDTGAESEHWPMLLFLVFITGLNAYSNFFLRNRMNQILMQLNKTFSLITFLGYLNLLIGKIFLFFNFNGLTYLFISDLILFILYLNFYKSDDFNKININFEQLNDADEILNYIFSYYSIINNFNHKRDSFFLFHSLMTKIEEKCYNMECPLKKYFAYLSKGVEYKYLLIEYCDKLFQHGLSKYQDDVNLKYYYSIFLIIEMNNKKKATILLNSLKYKLISFKENYDFYRCQHLIDRYNFQIQKKNLIIYKYRNNAYNLKKLISKAVLFQYEFLTFIYGSQSKRDDNFKMIYELGSNLLNYNNEIDKIFNELIMEKTNNIEIINLYSDYVEKILEDEEKFKKCQEMKKVLFRSNFLLQEKDFTNFDMRFLKDKDNYSYLIVSASNKNLGIIKDCSTNLVNIFGYEKKELIGYHINILIPSIYHAKHNHIFKRTSENHKLKFSENSYKRKVYNPDFMEKNVYGLSKTKFLIPVRLFIYLIFTEESELVYVVEVYRKIPLMDEIINNKIPCCVLTNQNFIIQSFTPNCMEYLQLKDNHISNYDIINNIKEFHEDYVLDFNTTHMSRNFSVKENSIIENKMSRNNLYITNMKRLIKTGILNRYDSRKCRITWVINKKKMKVKSLRAKRRSSSFNISFKKVHDKDDDEEEIEIELDMEIKKIKIENDLLGYYFYFYRINKENKMENNRIRFIEQDDEYKMNMHLKLPEFNDHNLSVIYENDKYIQTEIIFEPMAFQAEKSNNQVRRKSCLEHNTEKDLIIGPDYVCKNSSNFMFDVSSLSYTYSTDRNNINQLNENLKRDVITKIKINKYQYHSIKNRKKIFSLSQIKRYESTEIQGVTSSSSSLSSSFTNSGSSYSEEFSEESSSSYILQKKKSAPKKSFNLGFIRRTSKNVMTEIRKSNAEIKEKLDICKEGYLGIINKNITFEGVDKINNKVEYINNYYKLNLNMNNICFFVFDFYKEIFVEKKGIKKISRMENILNELKKGNFNSFGDDHGNYPIIIFEKKNFVKNGEEVKKIEEKKLKIKNDKKILETKIKNAISSDKDEVPIQRLKLYSFIFLIILMMLLTIFYLFFMKNYSKIKKILTLIKDIVKMKYCNRISVFFVGESTLLNFNATKIVGGLFTNFPGKRENKQAYINLSREKIKETYIETQSCLEEILGTQITFSESSTKFIKEHLLYTNYILKDGSIESLFSDIFTTLMQYNGAFYNLAFSPFNLEQNHTDILNFLHNSVNDFVIGIDLLISTYINELEVFAKSMYLYWIIILIIYFVVYVVNYITIIHFFILGYNKRTSYLEVFYELNENVLKNLILNCENLFKKLKESELKIDEEKIDDENLDTNVFFIFKEKQTRRNSLFFGRTSKSLINNQKKFRNKLPRNIKIFMEFFGFCLLFTFLFYIYNVFYFINIVENTKYISQYLDRSQHFQTIMIDLFVAYRQYIFDDSIEIYNKEPFDYLTTTLNKSYETISVDTSFIKNFNEKYLSKEEVNDNLTQIFCNYNFTDRFNTYEECKTELWFLLNYDFNIIYINFLEALRKSIYIVKYLIENNKTLGRLNDYNQDIWLKDERIPRVGRNNSGNYIFRLNLYNDDTVHGYLDLIFVNILLPYIDINRKHIIPYLSIEGKDYYLRLTTTFYAIIIAGIFFVYLSLEIKILNKHIYQTKNLLRLIPLNILLSLGNIKSLLDLN